MTWEKEDSIPTEVIQEFERGNKAVVTDSTVSRMGQTMHTLAVSQRHTQPHKDDTRPIILGNTGCVHVLDLLT